jgi:putative redox protein
MAIRPKTEVKMMMSGSGQSHARTQVRTRDVAGIIDEPVERGGTNLGLTPTETMVAALIGCTNVIAKRIAHGMGVEMGTLRVEAEATFDRRGTMLMEEVRVPFPNILLRIEAETSASEEQLDGIKRDLAKFCPIAKLLREAGTVIEEEWSVRPMPEAAPGH